MIEKLKNPIKKWKFFKKFFHVLYMIYRILRNKRPPLNKRPPSLFEITNYKELKEKSEIFEKINAKKQ